MLTLSAMGNHSSPNRCMIEMRQNTPHKRRKPRSANRGLAQLRMVTMHKSSSPNRWPAQVIAWAKAVWTVVKVGADLWHLFHL